MYTRFNSHFCFGSVVQQGTKLRGRVKNQPVYTSTLWSRPWALEQLEPSKFNIQKVRVYNRLQLFSLEPPPKNWFGRCCKNDDLFFFRLISKGVGVFKFRALTLSPCLKRRDPLSGEPTKSFRNIGKLRRDRTFVRVSQENMGRNWGVLLGTKWGYIKFTKRTHVNWE